MSASFGSAPGAQAGAIANGSTSGYTPERWYATSHSWYAKAHV
jgi:hypothetical protein